MGTHEYPWILQYMRVYLHSGYTRGYGADTCMIFIQQDGHGYHTIRTHEYSLTFVPTTKLDRYDKTF